MATKQNLRWEYFATVGIIAFLIATGFYVAFHLKKEVGRLNPINITKPEHAKLR